jgi:flagellar protein FlaJ
MGITSMFSKKKKKSDLITPPFKISHFITDKKKRTTTMSAIVGVVIIIASIQLSDMLGDQTIANFGVIAGGMALIIPFGIKQMKIKRDHDSIDDNLPMFVLSLISSIESGNSLLRAVEEAAGREMGSLTPYLRNLRANISWGMPQKLSFEFFTLSLDTPLSKRVGTLLSIALDMGGDVVSTLELVQHHVTEMQQLEKARKSELAPYVYTIYIAFVVFLVINALLVVSFFAEMQNIQDVMIEKTEGKDINLGMFQTILTVDVAGLTNLMFNMAIIEAIFGGLAAGKISDGSFTSGIKHMVIMLIAAVILYAILGI